MKKITKHSLMALLGCAALASPLFAQDEKAEMKKDSKEMTEKEMADQKMMNEKMMDMTVVEIAASNDDFSTLVAAVKAAGLAETLSGEGPFTVFAPTNEAFEKLPEGTVEMLLKPENKEKLVAILTYHVVPGKVMAADVKPMKAKSVEGSELTVTVEDDTVMIDKAKVIKTDLVGKNGVIHVIDTVLMPAE